MTTSSPVLRACALILLCLALYLPGQVALPPFDRDEARFAQASHQMIETGNYVDIRFQEEVRYKKPVGIYWLQVVSAKLTGAADQIWAYRVPSWLGATIAVLLTSVLIGGLFTPQTGVLAALLLASCLLLGVEARMAKTDAVQLACIVLAQVALARVWLGGAATPPPPNPPPPPARRAGDPTSPDGDFPRP
jgi:4-amino-4-deoxy-L-arabinose transferase-like glycosyltransferase